MKKNAPVREEEEEEEEEEIHACGCENRRLKCQE
jgi:hypothetical protein